MRAKWIKMSACQSNRTNLMGIYTYKVVQLYIHISISMLTIRLYINGLGNSKCMVPIHVFYLTSNEIRGQEYTQSYS